MALNVIDITSDIFATMQAEIPQDVYRQGVPDIGTLERDAVGRVKYYVAVQFGMPQARAQGKTFSGVRHDDYTLPIYVQVVGPNAENVEKIALGKVLDVMLDYTTDYAAHVEQRPGGAVLPMTQSNGATEAYVFPLSFGLTFQMNPS